MHISVCTEWIDVCDTRRWYFWMNTEYLSRCPTIIPIAFWKLWQCYNLTRRLHFGRCAKHSNKSRWCPGQKSNSLHPHHGRHLRFGVPTSSHLVFVDVCCLFVKLCLSCFKESRILSTLWNGKHGIQRGQRFDLWTKNSRILVRRVFSRAKMVSVRAPEENQGTHFHAMRWLLQAVDLRTSLKIWKRRHPLWSRVSWIWISQYSRIVLCFFPTSWRLPT